jgi:hypothetical protein
MNEAVSVLACSVAASLALVACALPESTAMNEEKSMQQAHAYSRPVYLRAMKTQLATPRAAIGALHAGADCARRGDVIWDDVLFRQVSHQLPKIFRRDLQRAHYQVPPEIDPVMLANPIGRPAYVEVDMQVQEVSAQLCKQEEGTSGNTYMKVFWQVYAAGASTPLYEAVTQGSHVVPVMEKRSDEEFFAKAFSAALGKLLAEPGFQEAVRQSPAH